MTRTPFQKKLRKAIRKGIELWKVKKYAESLSHLESVGTFFDESEPIYLRHYLCNLGIVNRALGQSDVAVTLYTQALSIPAKTGGERSDIAAINANLGNVLIDLERPDEAHKYLAKAEKYFREYSKHKLLGEVLENRARAYRAQGKVKRSRAVAHEAYKIMRRHSKAKAVRRVLGTLNVCWEQRK